MWSDWATFERTRQKNSWKSNPIISCHPTFTDQKWSQKYDQFPTSFTDTYPFCKTMRGYLDVAIAKNSQNSHAILCYRFATCSFVNFLQWLHQNNLAIAKKKLSVKLAKNGRKNTWSVKVRVHQLFVDIFVYKKCHIYPRKKRSGYFLACFLFQHLVTLEPHFQV